MLLNYKLRVPIIKEDNDILISESSFLKTINDESLLVENATMNCIRGYYETFVKGKSINIVTEGFTDFLDAIIRFLKNVWEKFVNFLKKIKNYIVMMFSDFDEYTKKNFDKLNTVKPFTVYGYKYTHLTDRDIDKANINKLVDDFNSEVGKIKDMKKEEFSELLKIYNGVEFYDKIRGQMVFGSNGREIPSTDYSDELFKYYRDGQLQKIEMEITGDVLKGYSNDYKKLKTTYEKMKIEENKISSMFKKLKYFFEHMPATNSDFNNRYIERSKLSINNNELKIENTDKDVFEKDYYLKLTAYYSKKGVYAKELALIYTKAYDAKIKALSEALSFYKTNIKRGINPFRDERKEV